MRSRHQLRLPLDESLITTQRSGQPLKTWVRQTDSEPSESVATDTKRDLLLLQRRSHDRRKRGAHLQGVVIYFLGVKVRGSTSTDQSEKSWDWTQTSQFHTCFSLFFLYFFFDFLHSITDGSACLAQKRLAGSVSPACAALPAELNNRRKKKERSAMEIKKRVLIYMKNK